MPMIHTLYGKHYRIEPIYVTPSDPGHTGVARERVYVIMTLKRKVEPIHDVQALYCRVAGFIQKHVQTKPSDYFVSTAQEQMEEASKTAQFRAIPLRPVPFLTKIGFSQSFEIYLADIDFFPRVNLLKQKSSYRLPPLLTKARSRAGPYSMAYLLNDRERRCVDIAAETYARQFDGADIRQDADAVLFLGDNADNRLTWSVRSGKVPTFRTGGGRMYNFKLQTWMTPKDRLAALGFPINGETASAMGVPVLPIADSLRAASVAGNSFHFMSAALVQLVALCSYRMKDS